jgi:hypothetical protein
MGGTDHEPDGAGWVLRACGEVAFKSFEEATQRRLGAKFVDQLSVGIDPALLGDDGLVVAIKSGSIEIV